MIKVKKSKNWKKMNSRSFIKKFSVVLVIFIAISALFLSVYEDTSSPNWMKALYFSNNNFLIISLLLIINSMIKQLYPQLKIGFIIWAVVAYCGLSIVSDLFWVFGFGQPKWIDKVTLYGLIIIISKKLWLQITG